MSENTPFTNTAQNLFDGIKPKYAISYLRVSTRGQAERGGGHDEGFSIPAQREANKRKALSMGAIIGKEFVDRGASAKSADRPQLQAMLKYVRENADRVDYVIVHKVDRLARNRDDDSDIMRSLRDLADHLAACGLTTRATPKIPSEPISKKALNQILNNPYYKGTIKYHSCPPKATR